MSFAGTVYRRRNEVEEVEEEQKSFPVGCGKRIMAITGVLTVILVICVVHVATSNDRRTFFDELLSTGGAIRSARDVHSDSSSHTSDSNVCRSEACEKVSKYIRDSMDSSKDPCTDFFDYACGGWIQKNPIPKTSSTYSTFAKLNGQVEKRLRHLLESEITENSSHLLQLPRHLYQSCLDVEAIEKRKGQPLLDLIEEMGSWSINKNGSWNEDKWELMERLFHIHRSFTSAGGPLFSVHISDDPVNNSQHIIDVDQAGPSLSREVYFDSPKIIKAYKQFIVDVGKLLGGDDDIEKEAEELVAFERELANISIPDADKTDTWFNRLTIHKLEGKVPGFPWLHYLNRLFDPIKLSGEEEILAPAIPYLNKMVKIVKRTPKRTLSNYLIWNVIQDEVSYLSKPFRDARMKYRDSVLGSHGHKKRWKTCVAYTNELLGDILGSEYVKHYFDGKRKDYAEHMIKEVRTAFKDNVNSISWMDKFTKMAVMDKADAMRDQVGFPDYLVNKTKFAKRFKKYSNLSMTKDSIFNNRIAIIKLAHKRMLSKLRKPVDKEEWPLDPQTINAMYSFNENQMIIPAGILQPPFFHADGSPSSLSFGAIGSILGHEMTHGFDNTGRKFNKFGELTAQWWSKRALTGFNAKADCIQKQYSQYRVNGKYPINGKLTLGENIADNGGFRSSYKAYHNWLKKRDDSIKLPGLNMTNEQLFFIGFGQAYCSSSRPTEQYLATLTDRHSEEKFRVIGTLSNSYEFADAFKCKAGSPMNPHSKCFVWCQGPKQPRGFLKHH